MIQIYENNKFRIYEYDKYEGLYYVWPKDDRLDAYYTDKEHVERLIKEGADFYGATQGGEKADDILFALQVMHGQPSYTYRDFQEMNLSQSEVNEALAYVKKKGYDKHTYFD